MAKKQTIIGIIHNVWGKSKSVYGRPSFFVQFAQECYEDEIMEGQTASDAECNGLFKCKKCKITYHETKKGTIIIERIDPISE